ncbi:sulfite exporter TauE/SafE family protein [Mucilaginibacter sp. PAMB04274]|uniref:sulfite exporter TauE/SafE family protein n=1 Tax=Mucilaginibacter sp. PAMB04274 TaxID=3138568 RepID=UPI0031F7204D
MTITLFTLLIFAGSLLAGLVGSLTGLGGGVVIIPLLTLLFGVDIHYAIGASLVSVIATSSGSAAAYVKEGISNIRVGMFLEIATTIGAVVGAAAAVYAPTHFIAILFGIVLIISAILSLRKKEIVKISRSQGKFARWLKLNGSYPTAEGTVQYDVVRVPAGFLMMIVAGTISGLLGIGSGALKVIAMDNIMKLPFKVSTTTSNFMIGVTATASAGIYFQRGYIDPGLCFPVVLGVLAGAMGGAKFLIKGQTSWLRIFFAIVIGFLAIQMIYNGISGKL